MKETWLFVLYYSESGMQLSFKLKGNRWNETINTENIDISRYFTFRYVRLGVIQDYRGLERDHSDFMLN